jgi:hypothetical protein
MAEPSLHHRALSPRGGINVKETKRMVGVNKPMAKRIAGALAFGLAVSTLATPSLAQRAEGPMSGTREKALRECNAQAWKLTQHSWGDHQIQNYRSCMMQHGEQQE